VNQLKLDDSPSNNPNNEIVIVPRIYRCTGSGRSYGTGFSNGLVIKIICSDKRWIPGGNSKGDRALARNRQK